MTRHDQPYWRQLWVVVATYANGPAVDSAQLFEANSRVPTDAEAEAIDTELTRFWPNYPLVTAWSRISTQDEHYAVYFIRACANGSACSEVNPTEVFLLRRGQLTDSEWQRARIFASARLRPLDAMRVRQLCAKAPSSVRSGAIGSVCG